MKIKCKNQNCSYAVSYENCPLQCPVCKAAMGKAGKEEKNREKPEPEKKTVLHPCIEIADGLYSVHYHKGLRYNCPASSQLNYFWWVVAGGCFTLKALF